MHTTYAAFMLETSQPHIQMRAHEPLGMAQAAAWFASNCRLVPTAQVAAEHGVWRGVARYSEVSPAERPTAFLLDPLAQRRSSRSGTDHYNLLLANLDSWSGFPDRQDSMMAAANAGWGDVIDYGAPYKVFAPDGTRWAAHETGDLLNSGQLLGSLSVVDISAALGDMGASEADWAAFRSDMNRLSAAGWAARPDEEDASPEQLLRKYLAKELAGGRGWADTLDSLLDPRRLKCSMVLDRKLSTLPYGAEVWTANTCLLVGQDSLPQFSAAVYEARGGF